MEIIRDSKREFRAVTTKNTVVYIINRKKFFEYFDLADRKALMNIYDEYLDPSELSEKTERDIREGKNQAKTLLDAAGINFIPSGRVDVGESKSMAWKRKFATDIVKNVRRRLS